MITPAHTRFIQRVHLFNGLKPEQFDYVVQHCRIQSLSNEESLFSQGDSVNHFYLIYSGLVKLFRVSADGQEKVIEVVTPGQTFAEALMFLERPDYPVSATALKDAEVIVFDSKHFLQMLSQSSDTCLTLLGEMSQRIRGLVQEIDNLSVQNGRHRLSSYLLQQAGETSHIQLPIPKAILASRLSIQPETFSRIIKQLKSVSVISVDGSEIEILDRQQLEEYSMG